MPYIVLHIRQSGQSIGYRTNPACEHSDQAFGKKSHPRQGGLGAGLPVWNLPAPGAPVSSSGAGRRSAFSPSRSEGGLHGQTAVIPGRGAALHRQTKQTTAQRSCLRRVTRIPAEKGPWLNPTSSAVFVSSLPPATTAAVERSWRMFTGCSFPARAGI